VCRSCEPGIEKLARRAFEACWRIRVTLQHAEGTIRSIAVVQ
jgi:hypothetical protein